MPVSYNVFVLSRYITVTAAMTLDIDLCFFRSDRVWEVEADAAVAGDDLAPPPVGAGGAGGLPW